MKLFSYLARLGLLVAVSGLLTLGVEKATELSEVTLTVYFAYLALVVTLSAVSMGLPWSLRGRAVVIFVMIMGAMVLNIAVELLFFSTQGRVNLLQFVVMGLAAALLGSLLVAWVFPSHVRASAAAFDFRHYFESRPLAQWIFCFSLAVLVYVVVYLVIGAIAYQFTKPYYTEGELGLVVPGLAVVVVAQFLRGSIYVCSVWLFLIGSRYRWAVTAGICALALFVLGGLTPLLLNADWPMQLRLYHGVEILFQNAIAGFMIALILRSGILSHPPTSMVERRLN